MVTGYTSSKLSQVSTHDLSNPYKVGVKGVTNVVEFVNDNGDNAIRVEYSVNGIEYVSEFVLNDPNKKIDVSFGLAGGIETDGQQTTFMPTISNRRRLASKPQNTNESTTTFKSFLSGNDFIEYPAIKEEEKLGQVFPPEINNEIFIERTSSNIYERHSRLEDINNIEQLEKYKNGFYNVVKQ